ncbi:MAG: PAS domain-containing sensor histidine kinase [Sphingobacteriaceae bacterium]
MTYNNDTDTVDTYNLDLFFELSPDLLCISSFDGYFKRINPAVSKRLGYTNEELYARPVMDFVHVDDRKVTVSGRNAITKENPLLNFENRYITKTGEVVWLSWTSILFDDGHLIFAIAKDVTYKKKMEEVRNLMVANLTVTNNDLKQLTYTASHDLRSPVNNLLSVFSILDLSKIEDEETLEFIGVLKLATENLRQTLNNYVDILSEKESLKVRVEEISLEESLQTVTESINSLTYNADVVFEIDFSAFERVKFNKAYLESIFLNLITNSIKYARPGYPPVISIRSAIINGVKQLSFTDNGQGFDMEKVKGKVFGLHQKFHTHLDSKGIGLYLVYNHITSLGGTIDLESVPEEGSKFTISFK